jgi:hypothetical protein
MHPHCRRSRHCGSRYCGSRYCGSRRHRKGRHCRRNNSFWCAELQKGLLRFFRSPKGGGIYQSKRIVKLFISAYPARQGRQRRCRHDWPIASVIPRFRFHYGSASKAAHSAGQFWSGLRVFASGHLITQTVLRGTSFSSGHGLSAHQTGPAV